jgi:hypothetical protein
MALLSELAPEKLQSRRDIPFFSADSTSSFGEV